MAARKLLEAKTAVEPAAACGGMFRYAACFKGFRF
jgi:hypothetical protein